jgi:hypothetical protein
MSRILTGNDLGRLGSLQTAPTAPEIEKYTSSAAFRTISAKHSGHKDRIIEEVHKQAHAMIGNNEIKEALLVLLAADTLNVRDL